MPTLFESIPHSDQHFSKPLPHISTHRATTSRSEILRQDMLLQIASSSLIEPATQDVQPNPAHIPAHGQTDTPSADSPASPRGSSPFE